MRIRVLGCSGAIAAGHRTTSFLVDEHLLVDAGTGVGDLTLAEMAAVDHILVSHAHLDHVLAIGLLADSVTRLRRGRPPVQVLALPETLQALRQHVFNGLIWPDFARLPSAQAPVLALQPIAIGQQLVLGGRRVQVLPALHTVPACGFAVLADDGAAWVYTGDTGPNPALAEHLAALDLRALVIETTFGDEEAPLAQASRHLCPATLASTLAALPAAAEVWITHIKPDEAARVLPQIAALADGRRIRALHTGQRLELGARG